MYQITGKIIKTFSLVSKTFEVHVSAQPVDHPLLHFLEKLRIDLTNITLLINQRFMQISHYVNNRDYANWLNLPAEPKARLYILEGLNLTQQTLAFASIQVTEFSLFVDHILTKT